MKITLKLDKPTSDTITNLMHHYKVKNESELFTKAISVLKIAAYLDSTHGELIARKGSHENKITVD